MNNLYDAKFCILDEVSIAANMLPEAEKDLKKYLSYNPIHNKNTYKELDIVKDDIYFYDFNREIIETDRSGWRHYDKIYTQYLSFLKNESINLLEIGIEYGYGLLSWSRYFPNAVIYGAEKLEKFTDEYSKIKSNHPKECERIHFNVKFDSSKMHNWELFLQNKKFDVIIDDGSHSWHDQYNTLLCGTKYLKEKFFYFIEDVKLDNVTEKDSILMYKNITNFAEKNNMNLQIYRHVNQYRVKLLSMSDSEKKFHLYERIITAQPKLSSEDALLRVKNSIKKDNGNYYNYMFALSSR